MNKIKHFTNHSLHKYIYLLCIIVIGLGIGLAYNVEIEHNTVQEPFIGSGYIRPYMRYVDDMTQPYRTKMDSLYTRFIHFFK